MSVQTETPIILFDGVCVFCSGGAMFVARRATHVKICAMQSDAGQALLRQAGLPTEDFSTFAVLDRGKMLVKSDAALRVAYHLGGAWRLFIVLGLLPRAWRDAAYGWIARRRYRIAGRKDSCTLPTPDLRERFLS